MFDVIQRSGIPDQWEVLVSLVARGSICVNLNKIYGV